MVLDVMQINKVLLQHFNQIHNQLLSDLLMDLNDVLRENVVIFLLCKNPKSYLGLLSSIAKTFSRQESTNTEIHAVQPLSCLMLEHVHRVDPESRVCKILRIVGSQAYYTGSQVYVYYQYQFKSHLLGKVKQDTWGSSEQL